MRRIRISNPVLKESILFYVCTAWILSSWWHWPDSNLSVVLWFSLLFHSLVNFSSEKARKALNASLPSAREERGTVLNISFTFMVVGTHVIWLDCLFMFCTLQVKMCYLSVSLTYDIWYDVQGSIRHTRFTTRSTERITSNIGERFLVFAHLDVSTAEKTV